MNIDNIAIVRATDIIPTEGIVEPISKVKYIKKSTDEPFAQEIVQLLKRKGLITPIDFLQIGNSKYLEEKNKETATVSSDYIPYTSSCNSMVLFSLNGLVPDDTENGFSNNIFSNKKCAVIDSLSAHIENVVSLNPTDTAIKGKVILSDNVIILIEQETYQKLSNEDKQKLNRFTVITFKENLKEAVHATLSKTNKYTAETLVLSISKGGYSESPTSEALKSTIKKIAKERNMSTADHLTVLRHNTDQVESLKSVEDEYENIIAIKTYYQNEFYKFLFSEMPVSEDLQYYLLNYNAQTYIEQLCEVIVDFGLDNYKKICIKYNSTLEKLQQEGLLPTPEEIITSINKEKPIDLCEMIRNYNIELYSAARENYQQKEIEKNTKYSK